jgi:hypothetical protein
MEIVNVDSKELARSDSLHHALWLGAIAYLEVARAPFSGFALFAALVISWRKVA